MPSGMCSRRTGFAETITSGCSLRSRHGYGMPAGRPSFPSNMTGPPIWSLPRPGHAGAAGRSLNVEADAMAHEHDRRLSTMVVFDMFGAARFGSETAPEECTMGDAGNGATLPRSTTARVDRRALMKSAAALLASTAVAGIGR